MVRNVIAPTYFYPGATDGWARVLTAAAYVSTVLINPDSGPGVQKLQDFATVTEQSQAAGMKVLGYVDSAYGARAVADVVSDMDAYSSWYKVDGFFIDDMYTAGMSLVLLELLQILVHCLKVFYCSCFRCFCALSLAMCCCAVSRYAGAYADTSKLQYYQQICNAAKNSSLYSHESVNNTQLVFNPGEPNVPEAYMTLADTFLTFEGSADSYQSFQPADYTNNYDASKFWHVVYLCNTNATINATLAQFNSQHARYLYITDLDEPNPYSDLPSENTWTQLLAYMASTTSNMASTTAK